MKRLCTICARKGSKGVINKNIRDFFGKPLIVHAIEIARSAKVFHVIAVSSDCDEILSIATSYADQVIKRPDELATDTAAKLPAIQHCAFEVEEILQIKFDTVVDISVTSPLLLAEDIQGAIHLQESTDAINVITGTIASNSPYFSLVEAQSDGYVHLAKKLQKTFTRRQDCPPCFDMNGAVYVWNAKYFYDLKEVITEKTLLYEMPETRSIDIDTELDFEIASYLFQKRDFAL